MLHEIDFRTLQKWQHRNKLNGTIHQGLQNTACQCKTKWLLPTTATQKQGFL